MMYRFISALFVFTFLHSNHTQAQSCCSGASSCPIAGGASQGVLSQNQAEVNTNYQYNSSTRFLNGDTVDANYLDRFWSNYNYLRLAYGMSDRLTFSVESGYYFNKTQIGLNNRDTLGSSGLADIILFPRYNVYHNVSDKGNFDVTVGAGLKIPIGSHTDSARYVEPFSGTVYYLRKPPAVQVSTGSHDFIFYALVFKGFSQSKFRLFSNLLYMRKGWNSMGEKAGDYYSAGLFFSKSFLKNWNGIMQFKAEQVQPIQLNKDLLSMGFYNYDTKATGGTRIFVVPQLGYSFKSLSIFASAEIPVYQYLNGSQIASQYIFNAGIDYKFFPFPNRVASGIYYCPMHPEITSQHPDNCSLCHMKLIQKK